MRSNWAIIWVVGMTIVGLSYAQTKTSEEKKSTTEVVLTQEDFKKYNCINVGDALKTITGVYVNSEGEIALRDVSSSKVVVVMDGQRLNSPGTTGVNVATISIDNIEKIELLRGGRSAQYGADAIGGVILITTKTKPMETGTTKGQSRAINLGVRATYGSYDRQILSLNNSFTYRNFNYLLTYKRDRWDGNFVYTDYYGRRQELVNNHQSSWDVFFKAGANLPAGQNVNASVYYYKADNGTPGMIDNPTPLARIQFINKSMNLTYDRQAIFKDFSLKAQSYYLFFNTKFDNPEGIVPVHSNHDNTALGLELQQGGTLFKNLRLTYGYAFRQDNIVSTDVGKKERVTHSAHSALDYGLNLDFFFSQLSAAMAVRYDAPSDFEQAFSPRLSLAAAHQGRCNIGLTAHVTRSYKAPSFNDLYWPRDAFAIGNPNLKPETGYNYDIGMTYAWKFIAASANYFNNDIKDLILWAQDASIGNLWTPKNVSKTSTKGVESSLTLTLLQGKLVLNGEYTYMKALDKSPDPSRYNKYIIYRPRNKFDLTTTLRIKGVEWNVIYHYVGLRYTTSANTQWLPAYDLIDMNINYHFQLHALNWTSTLEITNLNNEDYMKVLGTAEPGRMFKVSLGVNI